MRMSIMATVLLTTGTLIGTAIVQAQDAGADETTTIQSCSRLDGKEKAKCEWENHKLYLKMAKDSAANAAPVAAAPVMNLPSCSRLKGKEKANCEWENHKAVQAMLIAPASIPTSSAPSSSPSSASSKQSCTKLRGMERAKCIRANKAGAK